MIITLTPKERELLHSIIVGTMRVASMQNDKVLLTLLGELLTKLQ